MKTSQVTFPEDLNIELMRTKRVIHADPAGQTGLVI